MKKLILMCGIPGTGKSTFIKNNLHKFDGYVGVVSRDKIRFDMVKPNEPYFSKEKEVFRKFIADIKDCLEHCDTTIVDATHINAGSRNKLISSLVGYLNDVEISIIVIDTCLAVALAQNEKRLGTRSYVPESAIRNMSSNFSMPTFEEGFDKIIIYRGNDKIRYRIMEDLNE